MKVRKIAALAVGAAMVGATLGYASAAMPEKEFFVKDGEPNVKIVVGANAPSTMDVVSAADIAVALGTLLYTEKEVEAEATAVKVKYDTAYDPDDILVYKNIKDSSTNEYEELADAKGWWNGSEWDVAGEEVVYDRVAGDRGLWDGDVPTLTWEEVAQMTLGAVSYTHLTLPTTPYV